jgi:hypothetical protein
VTLVKVSVVVVKWRMMTHIYRNVHYGFFDWKKVPSPAVAMYKGC